LLGEEDLLRLELARVEAGNLRGTEERALARRDVVAVDRLRGRKRRERVEDEPIVASAAEAARGAEARQGDFVLERAVEAVDVDARRHILQVGGEEAAAGRS
jgi:hypothetical protein